MDPERWQRTKRLFQAAVDLEPSQRDGFLEQACSDDQALLSRLKSLLSSDGRHWDLIEKPAFETASLFVDDSPALSPRQVLGHYEIVALVGKGGMGEVYQAVDARLGRNIALK